MHELDVITGVHGFAAIMTVVELVMKYIEHRSKSHVTTRHHKHSRK